MAGQARLPGSAADIASNGAMYSVACPCSSRHEALCATEISWACEWPIWSSRRPSSPGQLLGLPNLPSMVAATMSHIAASRMNSGWPRRLRQRLHLLGRLHGGGVPAVLELRGQLDPQSLEGQRGVAELGPDLEDLARHRDRIADVARSVERPAPVQQDGGERSPVLACPRAMATERSLSSSRSG